MLEKISKRFGLLALCLILFSGAWQFVQGQTFFPNASSNEIKGFTITNSNSATNVALVTFTALNLNRSAIPGAQFLVYMSETSNGYVVSTTAGTSLQHVSGYGSVQGAVAASYGLTGTLAAIANTSGQFRIRVAPNTTVSYYPVAFVPTTGIRAVGTILTAAYSASLDFRDSPEFLGQRPLQQLTALMRANSKLPFLTEQ